MVKRSVKNTQEKSTGVDMNENTENKLLEKFEIKENTEWKQEEKVQLRTIRNSILEISRLVYDKEEPPKRCIAFSKNRRSVAFDVEMVPVIILSMLKITPEQFVPEEFRPTLNRLKKS